MARSLVLVLIDENGNEIDSANGSEYIDFEHSDTSSIFELQERCILSAPQTYDFYNEIGEFYRYEAGVDFTPGDAVSLPIYSTPYYGPWYSWIDGKVWNGEIRAVYKLKVDLKKTIHINVEILPVDIKDSGVAWAIEKELQLTPQANYATSRLTGYDTITINSVSYKFMYWLDSNKTVVSKDVSYALEHYYDDYPIGDTTLTFTAVYRPLTGKILLNKEGTEIVTYNGCIVLDL